MNKVLFIVFLLLGLISHSQKIDWIDVTEADLNFKFPSSYIVEDTLKIKSYNYLSSNKLIAVFISPDGFYSDADIFELNDLKKYYEGAVNGISDRHRTKVISKENYKINEVLLNKSIHKIVYSSKSTSIVEVHMLFVNENNYVIWFQYPEGVKQSVIDEKNYFLNSIQLNPSFSFDNQRSELIFEELRGF